MQNRDRHTPYGHGDLSKYEIRLQTTADYQTWDALIKTAPAGSVFNSTAWLDVVARLFGREVKIWGVYRNGEIVAGTALVCFRVLSIMKMAGFLPLTPYNSLVVQPRTSEKEAKNSSYRLAVLDLLARALEKQGDVVSIVNHPTLTDIRPFIWRGWNCTIGYTYLVDISNPGALWNSTYNDFRTQVRKCRREGFIVESGTDAKTLYRLYRLTYEKQGRRVYVDETSFCALCEVLKMDNRLVTYVTRLNGEAVSAVGIVKDYRGVIYAWVAGAHPDYLQHGVTPLTWWTALEELSKEGYHCFDLFGAGIPSIARFKSQLGGELTPFYKVTSQNFKSRLFEQSWGRVQAWGIADWLKQKLLNPGRI